VKRYWELTADNLSKAGWSWGCVSAIDSSGQTTWIADFSSTTGDDNTANGYQALFSNTTGVGNTAIGVQALYNNTTGVRNTAIGLDAGVSITGDGNVCIGDSVSGGAGENNTTRIRNIGSTPIVGGTNVVIIGTGGTGDQTLGYASSSRRYKEDVKPMDRASETLFALKPVTFQAKGDTRHVKHYGLIAEDVAMVDPDLAVYNSEGKPETLRFDSINAMVLNELLREHRRVEEQQATITQLRSDAAKQEATVSQLRKEMEVFAATLKEQAAQIQKVSAQLEANKPAPQVVNNP
jgi:trimeric autotransporter adhesin